jgi:hypothetical protein
MNTSTQHHGEDPADLPRGMKLPPPREDKRLRALATRIILVAGIASLALVGIALKTLL